jgi:superfamily II helicase
VSLGTTDGIDHTIRPLDGPDVVGVLEEQLLLFQPSDELGPARLDGVVGRLGKRGERE